MGGLGSFCTDGVAVRRNVWVCFVRRGRRSTWVRFVEYSDSKSLGSFCTGMSSRSTWVCFVRRSVAAIRSFGFVLHRYIFSASGSVGFVLYGWDRQHGATPTRSDGLELTTAAPLYPALFGANGQVIESRDGNQCDRPERSAIVEASVSAVRGQALICRNTPHTRSLWDSASRRVISWDADLAFARNLDVIGRPSCYTCLSKLICASSSRSSSGPVSRS